ncbi:MAG: gamma-glutamylcyclotransferase [Microcystaceae cyanobacterium]
MSQFPIPHSQLSIFVYGTLKPKETNYARYCQEKVIFAVKAYTWGEIYHLKRLGYPAMTQGKTKVQGYLLTFEDVTVLQDLDRLEGYQEQRSLSDNLENQYNRYVIDVYEPLSNKNLGKAWAYFMEISKIQFYQGEWLSSGEWTTN